MDKVNNGGKLVESKAQIDRKISKNRALALKDKALASKNKALIARDKITASKDRILRPEDKLIPRNNEFNSGRPDCFFLSNAFIRIFFFIFHF